jgi:integrase
MTDPQTPPAFSAAAPPLARLVDRSPVRARRVNQQRRTRWQPPEGFGPAEARALIECAACERDRLLLRTLWATGGRISEVLALRPIDVKRDHLVLVNLKNPARPFKIAALPAGQQTLPGDLLLHARELGLGERDPLFCSRQRRPDGSAKPLSRQQAWNIVRAASLRAEVLVLAVRDAPSHGKGEPAPVHPHLFRHARIRQLVRHTGSLPLAMAQAGWARLHAEYLTVGAEEQIARMRDVPE